MRRSESWVPSDKFDNGVMFFKPRKKEKHWFSGSKSALFNFFMSDLSFRGKTYKSVEHAYQCLKARSVRNHKAEQKIRDAPAAARAKLLAKHLKFSNKELDTWKNNRVALMKELLEQKYKQCPEFREELCNLRDKDLWGATRDDFWACGFMKFELQVKPNSTLRGLNVLGSLLMELQHRSTLKISPR